MKIASFKVLKNKTMQEALDQGFGVNFFDCSENEINLMLPTTPENLLKSAEKLGWTVLSNPLRS